MHMQHMAGAADDALANAISTSLAKALSQTVIGEKGSAQRESNADFYALVLSKTGDKFLQTDTGKKTLNKFLVVGLGGGVLLGLIAGYYLFKKRTP